MLRCSGGSVRAGDETRRSPTRISPSEGSRKPAISRKVVVLPQPDGPSRQTSCPWSIVSETLSTTASDENRLVSPRKSTDANPCLPASRSGSASAVQLESKAQDGDRGKGQALTLSPSHSIAASVPPLPCG